MNAITTNVRTRRIIWACAGAVLVSAIAVTAAPSFGISHIIVVQPLAACSNETLTGHYALRTDATPTTGGRRQNLALLQFNGDGTYDNLGFTVNNNGVISTGTLSALYTVNADCTGALVNPDGSVQGPIIVKENGDEYYFLRSNPANLLLTGVGTRIDNKHGDDRNH